MAEDLWPAGIRELEVRQHPREEQLLTRISIEPGYRIRLVLSLRPTTGLVPAKSAAPVD
ncbi:hypothetical protein [Micromonospora sp. NPDC005161]